jgi:probable HAF family extracellular repeat protein
MQDLGSLGGTLSVAGARNAGPFGAILNNRGQAIGTSTLPGDEIWHGFLWDNGVMKDLGTAGGNLSEALAISASGLVVGRADFSPSSPNHHAVLWKEATITDLGVVSPCKNSTATSVNSSGKVVGNLGGCTNDSSDVAYSSAFVWKRGGEMVDLNTLVRNPTDLHLDGASFINNRGEIAGGAVTPTGEGRSVLLIPVSDY